LQKYTIKRQSVCTIVLFFIGSPKYPFHPIYQTEDGQTQIDVRLENDTVWLTQAQMAELFQKTPQNITMHIGNAYKEGELERESTCKEYLQVQQEGKRKVSRKVKYYDLDVIISVGYRVHSKRGTAFRIFLVMRRTTRSRVA